MSRIKKTSKCTKKKKPFKQLPSIICFTQPTNTSKYANNHNLENVSDKLIITQHSNSTCTIFPGKFLINKQNNKIMIEINKPTSKQSKFNKFPTRKGSKLTINKYPSQVTFLKSVALTVPSSETGIW